MTELPTEYWQLAESSVILPNGSNSFHGIGEPQSPVALTSLPSNLSMHGAGGKI